MSRPHRSKKSTNRNSRQYQKKNKVKIVKEEVKMDEVSQEVLDLLKNTSIQPPEPTAVLESVVESVVEPVVEEKEKKSTNIVKDAEAKKMAQQTAEDTAAQLARKKEQIKARNEARARSAELKKLRREEAEAEREIKKLEKTNVAVADPTKKVPALSADQLKELTDNKTVSIPYLKKKCRQLGVKGYSKMNKADLVKILVKEHSDDPDVQKISLLVQNMKNLKRKCRQLGITGYSELDKQHIVARIISKESKDKNVNQRLENALKSPAYADTRIFDRAFVKDVYDEVSKRSTADVTHILRVMSHNKASLRAQLFRNVCRLVRAASPTI